ncbi:MAG: hypothetical protein HC902_06440 [Calothrix sp. SM1_5_4]|nr:hypothetical protein [Calothrix sp. SM1_5_4]
MLVIFVSGVLLSLSPNVGFLQPKPANTSAGGALSLPFERILQAAATVPGAAIRGWEDVTQIDYSSPHGRDSRARQELLGSSN